MLPILLLVFCFLFSPLNAWAYFDPGFGGYLASSLISWALGALAFMGAAIIFFFRTIIVQRSGKFILPFVLIVMCFVVGISFYNTYLKFSHIHPSATGAKIKDPERLSRGYDLYNGKLIDAKGRIVKQWSQTYLGVIDKNGDYYAQEHWRASRWGRYTWDDHVIWEKDFPIHHTLYLSPQGTVFTFSREPHDYNGYKVNFDIILEFDKDGHELGQYSFWDHLNEFKPFHQPFQIDVVCPAILRPFLSLSQMIFHHDIYDYFHINSFFILPPNPLENINPAFRPGNWLISIFHGSMVFILDQDTKKILWHAVADEVEGGLQGQHCASMLASGNILLFDNGISRRASRILIFDPLSLKARWQYSNEDFYSGSEGYVQALANGNFLVTESTKNHAFELTPDKRIVWDYYDPSIKNDDMYSMTRYPKEMIDGLLAKEGAH